MHTGLEWTISFKNTIFRNFSNPQNETVGETFLDKNEISRPVCLPEKQILGSYLLLRGGEKLTKETPAEYKLESIVSIIFFL